MPELKVRIGCVALAVVMSAVTYYLVEPRLRWGRYGGYKAAGLLSVMVVIGVAGYSVEKHDGYTVRMNDPEQPVIDAINKRLSEDNRRCLKEIPDWNGLSIRWPHMDLTQCKLQRPSGKNTIAVIGDSHAGHLYSGLSAMSGEHDGIAVFPAGCAVPLIGLHSWKEPNTEHQLSEGFRYILSHKNIKKVVLSHRPFCTFQKVVDTYHPENHDVQSILRDGFVRTYGAMAKAGKEVYVLLDNPAYSRGQWSKCQASVVKRPAAIPDFLFSQNSKNCSEKLSERVDIEEITKWNKISYETARLYKNVHFIDLSDVFCKNDNCSMLDSKGSMLYLDSHHLNVKGSIYVAPYILEKLGSVSQ